MPDVSKAVLITGCSTGIGRATAERLVRGGHTVYATARRLEAIEDLEAAGARTLALDVNSEESMQAAVAAVEEAEGAVGALVNNAGYSQSGAVEGIPLDSLRSQFETNVFGLVRMCQLVLPAMRRQGHGRIVNVSSMGGKLTFPGGGAYHATKHAVEALSDALRFEVAGFGVAVSIIEPGLIKTPVRRDRRGLGVPRGRPLRRLQHRGVRRHRRCLRRPVRQAGRRPRRRGQGDREGDHRAPSQDALPGHRLGPGVPDPARAAARPRLGPSGGDLVPPSIEFCATSREGAELPYFKDADEVYAYIGKLFEDLAADDEMAAKFNKANTIVQYQYREPESRITVKLIEGEDGQVDCGQTTMEPEVVMTMDADTAHRFWLGKVNVTVALARGQMKAKGPVAKILKLVPLVKPVFPRYRQLLADGGRQDLLEAS